MKMIIRSSLHAVPVTKSKEIKEQKNVFTCMDTASRFGHQSCVGINPNTAIWQKILLEQARVQDFSLHQTIMDKIYQPIWDKRHFPILLALFGFETSIAKIVVQ
jgi:hypothetical protein